MNDGLPDPPSLDPATLAGASFGRTRRGFEPTAVHSLLGRAADALRVWSARDEHLRDLLSELRERLEAAEQMDEAKATELLGAETGRIIATARSAATEMRTQAELDSARIVEDAQRESGAQAEALVAAATADREQAAAMLAQAEASAAALLETAQGDAEEHTAQARATAAAREAEAEAVAQQLLSDAQGHHDELIAEAGSLLDARTAEADAAAREIRTSAADELELATTEAAQLRAEAMEAAREELERSREQGREMVSEAKAVRQRMLRDLAERSRAGRQKVEAASAAREGIVEAIRVASRRLDEVLGELSAADDVIREAADSAAASVVDDVDQVVAELEAQLEAAEAVDGVAADTDHDTSGEASDADGTGTVPGSDPEDPQMASVHDLFERLRAEDASATPADNGPTAPDDEPDRGRGGEADAAGATTPQRTTSTGPMSPPSEEVLAGAAVVGGAVAGGAVAVVALNEVTERSQDDDTALLDRRDDLLAPAERLLARNLKRLIGDEQNEVLDRVRRHKRGRISLEDVLGSSDTGERFAGSLSEPYALAAAAGSQMFCEQLQADPVEVTEPSVGNRLQAQVDELLELRRLHLRDVFEQLDESGDDQSVLVDRLRAAYRELRATSVPELAADLANGAFNAGAGVAASSTGSASWRWVPDNGGLPCSDAEDNALAGPVRCGEAFPTGDCCPPAHPGCRCMLVPAPA